MTAYRKTSGYQQIGLGRGIKSSTPAEWSSFVFLPPSFESKAGVLHKFQAFFAPFSARMLSALQPCHFVVVCLLPSRSWVGGRERSFMHSVVRTFNTCYTQGALKQKRLIVTRLAYESYMFHRFSSHGPTTSKNNPAGFTKSSTSYIHPPSEHAYARNQPTISMWWISLAWQFTHMTLLLWFNDLETKHISALIESLTLPMWLTTAAQTRTLLSQNID